MQAGDDPAAACMVSNDDLRVLYADHAAATEKHASFRFWYADRAEDTEKLTRRASESLELRNAGFVSVLIRVFRVQEPGRS